MMPRKNALYVSLLVAGLLWPRLAGAQVELETPVAGWNSAGLTDKSDQVAAAYPPNLIDRGAQKARTIIRGRLAATDAERSHTLVVNGNAMPLYGGADRTFARPYAFGTGSNSVEVRAPSGERRRVQFYEAGSGRAQARIRIILGWDDDQAEVDLHVVTPDGQHAFWGDPVLSNGGGLDVDSVDGAGPEMFSMTAPLHGAYHVYVNYWGNFDSNGYHFDESTRKREIVTTDVTLVFDENTPREKRETFIVPLRKIGDLTLVKSFLY
jgi:uncharacterized protein YfaP (DUF2135 family)